MELYERLEQILVKLRPAFSREAPFEWFVLLLWSVLLTTQPPAVTSYLNALGLGEGYYHQALHWFHSSAFSIDDLCYRWGYWLRTHPNRHRLKGQRVYVGDGISREQRRAQDAWGQRPTPTNLRMSVNRHGYGVTTESALGLLLGAGQALFATPIVLKLHDGIETVEADT